MIRLILDKVVQSQTGQSAHTAENDNYEKIRSKARWRNKNKDSLITSFIRRFKQ